MSEAISQLDVAPATSEYDEWDTRWFRTRRTTHRIEFMDWAVDGRPLRQMLAGEDGEPPQEVTALHNPDVPTGFKRQTLRALLAESEPTEHWTTMPDGRVALLYCNVCYDLDCATLTTELVFEQDLVQWVNIGWQVGYEPFELNQDGTNALSFTFERWQYEAVLRTLLASA